MRLVLQGLILLVSIAAIAVIARGLGAVSPAAAGVARALLHPVGIAAVLGILLLIRVGRGARRRGSDVRAPRG
jgi:hypothetical protein